MPTAESTRIPLSQVCVATPCHERWEDMKGDEARRFCDSCGLFVHNLSAMTQEQADAFVTQAAAEQGKKRTCIRMYTRADGTVISRDCPVGVARLRDRAWIVTRRVLAACVLAGVSLLAWRKAEAVAKQGWPDATQTRGVMPFSWISQKLGSNAPAPGNSVIMGEMACPTPPTLPQHVRNIAGLPEKEGGR